VTDEPVSDLSLADILAASAEELEGIATGVDGGSTTWSAASRVFATLTGDRAEFHLDPLVVRAALRTPDTAPSSRGSEWIAFSPAVLDDPAVDRAEAWFLSAHRLATAPRH
jgi:acyl dehydratase